MADQERIVGYCRTCRRNTNHDISKLLERSGYEEEAEFSWHEKYMIIGCRGCETISFRVESSDSESRDYDGSYYIDVKYYPEHNPSSRTVQDVEYFPDKVARLYGETITAINAGAYVLASAGLRATVEAICQEEQCIGDNLEKRIDDLVRRGVLASKQSDYLHLHRYIGNDAVHEMRAPQLKELATGLDILEALLKTVYVLPPLAEELKNKRRIRGQRSLGLGLAGELSTGDSSGS